MLGKTSKAQPLAELSKINNHFIGRFMGFCFNFNINNSSYTDIQGAEGILEGHNRFSGFGHLSILTWL